jgi:hypothetical protein
MTLDVEIAYLKVPWLSELEKFFLFDLRSFRVSHVIFELSDFNMELKKTISDGDMTYARVLVPGTI